MRILFLLFISFFSFQIFAQGKDPVPYFFKKFPYSPVTVTWLDGRKAKLVTQKKEPLRLSSSFIITENLCNGSLGDKGELGSYLLAVRYAWEWVNHPDPKRIGKLLEVKRASEDVAKFKVRATEVIKITKIRQTNYPGYNRFELPAEYIHFQSMNWWPKKNFQHIAGIYTEKMFPNPENGTNENRIISGIYDVDLKMNGGKLNFESVRERFSIVRIGVSYPFFGTSIYMNLRLGEFDFCQVSLKPRQNILESQIQDYLDNNWPKTHEGEFIWQNPNQEEADTSAIGQILTFLYPYGNNEELEVR